MSTELLLLLVFFILLPLLQRLLRAVRQPDQHTPERPGAQPASEHRPAMPELHPPAQAPPLRAPAVPRLPATARQQLSEATTARDRTPARDAAGPVTPAPTARGNARRRTAVADLRSPGGLRRAIVLMAILGPCRASER